MALDNATMKPEQTYVDLVSAFQRGELSFVQMAKKAKRVHQRDIKAAKKQADAQKASKHK